MDLGAIRTRYEGWSRGPALALIAALIALLALARWSPASAPAPKVRTSAAQHSDLQLYRDIIAGVHAGGGYYKVAADELRKGGYPLKPFFTFRLPTQALAYATFGERTMIVVVWLLCAGLIVAWWQRLKPCLPLPLLAAAMILIAGGLGGMLQPMTGLFHESWAALLLALMIGIYRPERAWPAIIAGAAALMIRELALPMILAMGGLALIERRWREAAAWAAVVAVFAAYMVLHAHWVSEVVRPGDPASQGWSRMLGAQFALKSIAKVTFGIRLPEAVAAGLLVLSLFGWVSVRSGWAVRATLLLAGYGAMVALFARADTFYWALLAAPLSFAGLAFLPNVFTDLAKAMRKVPNFSR
ncbi:hypothetical protein LVY65_02255 [Sphingomonas sp. G124]|uniref:Uncharacterized protein n=1 Tax=Sphingomonas cremea TaxID=2904799 RepID=A0A9X1TXJ1_9SPHN|nr:hypothetical protein [Sphingomonas cremea]MCF2513892.1 hypothetical protein [Sphingomonas cremea]